MKTDMFQPSIHINNCLLKQIVMHDFFCLVLVIWNALRMLSDIIISICEIEGLKKTNEWRSIKFVMPTKWPHRILAIMMSNDNRSIFLWDILYLRISKYLNRGHRSASYPSLPIHNGSYIPEINAQTWMNLMNIFSYSFLISLLSPWKKVKKKVLWHEHCTTMSYFHF